MDTDSDTDIPSGFAICGDGIPHLPEMCDDSNPFAGDGCSDRCAVEPGFACEGSPSRCTRTVCGDGVIEGTEGCDAGNALPFDGVNDDGYNQCAPGCVPSEEYCGDGRVQEEFEDCDDGNLADRDECPGDCHLLRL